MEPGELFYVAPGHDSWVVGDEPYVSLHFLGAGDYATVARSPRALAPRAGAYSITEGKRPPAAPGPGRFGA